jgi:D-alanine--poly(phosphoribitol) ligase subunit 1
LNHEILRRYPSAPVGAPMPGAQVYLIDESLERLPDDARGEIVIAGPNVTPGYLDAPDRNAAAFVWHEGRRGYRTGDIGYFRDVYLFCDGRIDGQIKLNGYRIELGDIEANLRALPDVHEAIVLPAPGGGVAQSLAAFVHVAGARDFERTARLKAALLERLPAYMVPRRFVYLDKFPVTPNGKVDRRALARALV